MRGLGIDAAPTASLFSYEHLEKEVIDKSMYKAEQKLQEPMCDFCFIREKDLLKCMVTDGLGRRVIYMCTPLAF